MRRANGSYFVENKNKKLYGINFGSDFVSEHEWGIDNIKRDFGVTGSFKTGKFGITNRIISTIPEIKLYDGKINSVHYTALIYFGHYSEYLNKKTRFKTIIDNCELNPYNNNDLMCSWDERTFGILVSDKYKSEIEELYTAFQNKDIAVWIPIEYFDKFNKVGGDDDAFLKGNGLNFFIKSKIPDDIIKKIYEKDEDHYNLLKAAENTGIYDILRKAKKEYFSLSPRWKDENKKSIIFWLNPIEQQTYNYGWFTVDDLKDWANNTGKIMMH